MTYWNSAAQIFGNFVMLPDRELLPHIVAEHGRYLSDRKIGALDAPEYIVAGACRQRQSGDDDYWSAQQMFSRDMLDAYEYTDRTAGATDCASDRMRGAA